MLDLKIINGKVPDFKTNTFNIVDISIKNGKIVQIGTNEKKSKVEINAGGKIVSPGFIDIHAHEDVIENDIFYAANYSLNMGVTTNIGGNCGINKQSFEDFVGYLNKNGAPTNYAMALGNQYVRKLIGLEEKDRYRSASKIEIEKMQKEVRSHLKYGILGLSYGIEYIPGVNMEEIIGISEGLNDKNYILSAHYRSDCEKSIEAIHEMAEISKMTERPMQISHLGSCSAMGYMKESLGIIDSYINNKVDILSDCYPYDAFCTYIGSAVFDDGCFQRWNKTYSDILLTSGPNKGQRCDEKLFYQTRERYPDMSVIAFVMNDDEVELAYKSPHVMVASDSLFNKDTGHPRGAGTFPRIISRYVNEKKTISLLEALKKMTIMPANRARLFSKGQIQEGKDADIVIFDDKIINDEADFMNPTLPPKGIDYVIIGGKISLDHGKVINDRLGKYIFSNTL